MVSVCKLVMISHFESVFINLLVIFLIWKMFICSYLISELSYRLLVIFTLQILCQLNEFPVFKLQVNSKKNFIKYLFYSRCSNRLSDIRRCDPLKTPMWRYNSFACFIDKEIKWTKVAEFAHFLIHSKVVEPQMFSLQNPGS